MNYRSSGRHIPWGSEHTGDLWITRLTEGEGKGGVRTRGLGVGEGECGGEHRRRGGDTPTGNPLVS